MPLSKADRDRLIDTFTHDAVSTFPGAVADARDRLGATAGGLYEVVATAERASRASIGWQRLRAAHTTVATEYHLPVAVWLQALRGDDALAHSLDRLVDLCLAQWRAVEAARWTPDRVAFVVAVMAGHEPRMPMRLRDALRAAWDDERGVGLSDALSPTGRTALESAMGGPAGTKISDTAAAERRDRAAASSAPCRVVPGRATRRPGR